MQAEDFVLRPPHEQKLASAMRPLRRVVSGSAPASAGAHVRKRARRKARIALVRPHGPAGRGTAQFSTRVRRPRLSPRPLPAPSAEDMNAQFGDGRRPGQSPTPSTETWSVLTRWRSRTDRIAATALATALRQSCHKTRTRGGLTSTCPPARRAVLALPCSLHALMLCLFVCGCLRFGCGMVAMA
jgi:hypothetical protein